MGGVVDSGVGIGTKSSPRCAAIEKAQAELRLEYDVREERRRELEFLEKGGNSLDFKFGHTASVSVQSTSFTDQHHDQFVTSEAKGSFALTASPRGDSVESSGRLGVTVACEPNSADNFDGENELFERERKSIYPSGSNITPSEHTSQLAGNQIAKGLEDSPIFHLKKGQAYRRRNRSRTNRDGAQSSSTDIASRGGHVSSSSGRLGVVSKTVYSDNRVDMQLDGVHAITSATDPANAGMLEAGVARPPCVATEKTGNCGGRGQLNESSKLKADGKCISTEVVTSNVAFTTKGLDSESFCTQTSSSVVGNANVDSDLCTNLKNVDCNGAPKGQKQAIEEIPNNKDDNILNGNKITNPMESDFCTDDNHNSVVQIHQSNSFTDKDEKEISRSRLSGQNDAKCPSKVEESQSHNCTESKSHNKDNAADDPTTKLESCYRKLQASRDGCVHELVDTDISVPGPALELQACSENYRRVVDKAHEDRILEEARTIEAKRKRIAEKRKRIAELSVRSLPTEYLKKSHWDFVLEEMAWLANDFAQERLWKMTATAQICHQAAFASCLNLEGQSKYAKLKTVSQTLVKAVMEFWRSAEQLLEGVNTNSGVKNCNYDAVASRTDEIARCRIGGPDKGLKYHEKSSVLPVQGYAVRFLQYNSSASSVVKAEVSETLDRAADVEITELPWQDQFTEVNLFYSVPPGAMETYRKSVESYLVKCEKMDYNMQLNADTSMFDAATEFGFQENEYEEEEEGESLYYLPGAFEGSRSLKVVQNKRKNMKSYIARSDEFGGNFAYGQSVENRSGTPQSGVIGRRSTNSLNVGPIPTKRMRTASRQRVAGPFSIGAAGGVPAPSRTDASSGDTNSFQDDQSTLHGGSIIPNGSEVESGMDFDKHLKFNPTELPSKAKKKKKAKQQSVAYDRRWQVDSRQDEQRDHLEKRLDSHPYESNGSSGLFGQHAKHPKIMKQSLDSSFENTTPMSGSIASPMASQMCNMSNPNKFTKLFGGRDRDRKSKAPKVPIGQIGSGSPWSLFEDQALVVLVHDMGPNWELVSDAINSTLQFKCIFRKSNECKERHKNLMDRTSGDGADSAEDSGSSQPYPSTLPGIPKGSARQLFQRLQGPMEEDTIKSHFEKIILIGQQLHYRKKQDLKQIAPVHGSHVAALSEVIPNNLNGGVLTPLDLCDANASSPDVFSLGCQGLHSGGLASSNQVVPQILPSPGAISSLRGSPGINSGSNLASGSAQLNGPVRDGKFGVPGSTTVPIDEQQRIQQYNHLLSNRSIQQSNMSVPGSFSGTDRNVRMLSSGNGMSMPGMNRSMPMSKPGFQGIASSAMMNLGTMVTSNMVRMPGTINMQTGAGLAQGNSMLRPRDALHLVRPGQSAEHQKQMMLPDMQMQVTQANSQGVHIFGGLSSGFPSQSVPPPVHTFPVHHQQQQHQVPQQHSNVLSSPHHPHLQGSTHPATAEQQAYALRLARERQLQQRMLQQRQQQQQQNQQFPASSVLMSNAQTQFQFPISPSLQNSSQIQSQAASQPVSLPSLSPSSPMTPTSSQQHHKNQLPPHALGRNPRSGASGVTNQTGKQRQRQPHQQSGRHHPQQRQQSQSLQQAKILKGIGRGNMLMHQNIPLDPSHLNGLSSNPVNQAMEKGEQPINMIQGQGLYSGSNMNSVQQSKALAQAQPSGQLQTQQEQCCSSAPASSKQVQQMPSHPEISNQCQVQAQPPLKLVSKTQSAIQRSIQQSRQVSSDRLAKSQAEQTQVKQQFANNTSTISNTSGIPPVCIGPTSPISLSSSASTAPWKVPEISCDFSMPNSSTQMGSLGSPPIPISSGNEPLLSGSQVLGHRQLSGNLSPHAHPVGSQRQQQQLPPLQPVLPPKQIQQQQQQLEQSTHRPLPSQQQPQQQIQAGQSIVPYRIRSACPQNIGVQMQLTDFMKEVPGKLNEVAIAFVMT
ncbi:hypothetical protein Nepgr_032777 [Nepenthes gracilis]|uniref:Myb-like domain-containing protein n=1 Tax=Nepenthes gracilis TaxID=150966 RepID=A0AAD3TKQ6_NEPGR|nr:hypothetical protein Nepgr_032777 [Nepenthes gracilis]